jgi:hypothetical protein
MLRLLSAGCRSLSAVGLREQPPKPSLYPKSFHRPYQALLHEAQEPPRGIGARHHISQVPIVRRCIENRSSTIKFVR